ncbi:MAG TPA: OmcA/MtrC family decaheme c-type cytochrome [Bryobacteraceae bacterium]|nr:OmcA/MtrC family decaheme c-type cytochrome [Bryobacteraceae bacterium]
MRTTGSLVRILGALIALAGTLALTGAQKQVYSKRDRAFYADPALVDFVRPGLVVKINSAAIAADGTITVTYTITDPMGLPLDATGVNTPGAVSFTYAAAYIPAGQEQYVSYQTASATGNALGTITRPGFVLGGPGTLVAPGQYTYTFPQKAPSAFDATATTTVAVLGSRDLTTFDLGTNIASNTYSFVPNGSAVKVTRDVIRTASCNGCHDQLAFHGGHAQGVEMCVLCHQPQNQDPVTGNTLDLKVMVHKIHMGSSLPSVLAGKPYQIAGYRNIISDFSDVEDPADARRCQTCHSQTTGAAQATAYMTEPTRAACGSCHDDVDFATGANHPGGIQNSDKQCANCHLPQGEMDFDASIQGAHMYPTESSLLSGLVVTITNVQNNAAGSAPVVSFNIQDKGGNPVALSALGSLSLTMAGPTTDYGTTSFGADVTTPGYVTESAVKTASCGGAGRCTYTFTHPIPAGATGTYAIAIEARRSETVPQLIDGTTKQTAIQYGAANPVTYFSVDGTPLAPRRKIIAEANCNACHVALSLHGTLRNNVEYCAMCHNPSNTDAARRPGAQVPSDKTAPPQGINFNLLVHRIHDGTNVVANGGKPYIVVGFGGSHNDFSGVGFPAMNAEGATRDLANCAMCHVNGSEQNDLNLSNLNPVTDPQGLLNPVQPFTSACTGCHVDRPAASHALSNTTQLGEACAVCHNADGEFSVDKVHAGK